MKLRDFLSEYNWCQGWYARDSQGNDVHFSHNDAVQFSIMGAMLRLYPDMDEYNICQDRMASLIRVLYGKRIEEFNDSANWQQVEHILEIVDV